jgi:predicted phage replisome organizer
VSEVKWIKITTDMFENRKIRYLRKLPDGNNIVLIWVMLLSLAGKCNANGMIFLTENVPYTTKMLADELDFEENTVVLAIEALERLGMIRKDDYLFIEDWAAHQNVDGLDKIREQTRKRVSEYRDRQRELISSQVCQYCGGKATGYDHVIALSRGGKDDDTNRVPCCIECNRIKNDKPLVDFLNNNRERIDDSIVKANPILSSLVTLCNVTGRYEVTQCNAPRIREENKSKKESENNNINNNEKVNGRFIPPTVEEVKAYCEKLGYGMDAEHFVAYYTANGWKVGKNPMKSWQSAVVNWEKNDKERSRNGQKANRTIPKEYHIEEAF